VVATNRKHPNPAVRCRGNLRRSGRRGCQAVWADEIGGDSNQGDEL